MERARSPLDWLIQSVERGFLDRDRIFTCKFFKRFMIFFGEFIVFEFLNVFGNL
jgi:hypothetical protein